MKWQRFMEVGELSVENEEDLLNTLYRHMFIVAYAKMKNKTDALDVVQEAWIKILQKLDTLKDPKKLVQWSKAIAANTAMNALKRKAADAVQLYDEHMCIGELSFDLRVEERILKRAVYESLSLLDEETRTMMICKFYYDWKDRQIAEVVEMPVGTVKARIHRAKKLLREHLQAEFGADAAKDGGPA